MPKYRITLQDDSTKFIDADGYFIVPGGGLSLYLSSREFDEDDQIETIEDMVNSMVVVQIAVASFAGGQWKHIYEVGEFESEH